MAAAIPGESRVCAERGAGTGSGDAAAGKGGCQVSEDESGVRRLCIAVAAGRPGLFASACRSRRFDRLYVWADPRDALEVGVAPPGVGEVDLVNDLIELLYTAVSTDRELAGPVLLALHVGITRVVDEGFEGAGMIRAKALLEHRAVRDMAGADAGLAVVVSDGLYTDLRAEGLAEHGWCSVASAAAWLRSFAAARGERA